MNLIGTNKTGTMWMLAKDLEPGMWFAPNCGCGGIWHKADYVEELTALEEIMPGYIQVTFNEMSDHCPPLSRLYKNTAAVPVFSGGNPYAVSS